MRLLTINAGSSSVRLGLYEQRGGSFTRAASLHEEGAAREPEALLRSFLREVGAPVDGVVHRVVHGGANLTIPLRLDAAAEREIAQLGALAPLHNPVALRWISAAKAVVDAPEIAVFDTAFYADLPPEASEYALPRELCQRYGLRRYGFHGLAHQAMVRRFQSLSPSLAAGRLISLQLGGGCSITATVDGRPRDTSMGFSPLEGLVMATRSGDLDPGLLTYLPRAASMGPDALERLLYRESGLLGLSGESGDMRRLLASARPEARQAISLYCYRAKKYIGSYLAALGGADAVLFGGGVGENAPAVRAEILAGMEWCGVQLDPAANSTAVGREGRLSAPGSPIEVWALPVDEGQLLAEEAAALLSPG